MADVWFKFHNRARHSRKVNAIADKHFRNYIMLSTLASEHGGKITKDLATLSFELHRKPGQVRESLQVLLSIGLIEDVGEFYRPSRWGEMQLNPTGSTLRMREWRERNKAVTVTKSDGHSDGKSDGPVTTEVEVEVEVEVEKETKDLRSLSKKARSQIGAFVPDQKEALEHWRSIGRSDIDSAEQAEQFQDHHKARASLMADWPAAWRTWYRNAPRMNRQGKSNGRSNTDRPTPHDNFIEGARRLREDMRTERGR